MCVYTEMRCRIAVKGRVCNPHGASATAGSSPRGEAAEKGRRDEDKERKREKRADERKGEVKKTKRGMRKDSQYKEEEKEREQSPFRVRLSSTCNDGTPPSFGIAYNTA